MAASVHQGKVAEFFQFFGLLDLDHGNIEELDEGSVLTPGERQDVRNRRRNPKALANPPMSQSTPDRIGIGMTSQENDVRLVGGFGKHLL